MDSPRIISERRRQRAAQRKAETERLGEVLQASLAEARGATGGTDWEVQPYHYGNVGVSRSHGSVYLYIEGTSAGGWRLDVRVHNQCFRKGENRRPYHRLAAAIAEADRLAAGITRDLGKRPMAR